MGAKERSEKLRRRKSSLEEEGQRGSENGVFALSRGKGQIYSRLGPVQPTLREGAPGGRRGRRGPWGREGGGLPAPGVLPEPFLSRRVPELQLYPLAGLDLQQAGEEVHADGGVAGWGAQPRKAALSEAVQEARLSHGGVPDDDEAELVDPDGLHRSRAQLTLRPPHPPTRRRANKAAGTVRSAPPRRPPAGFQHIPAAAAATRSPPSLEGEAGPGRGRGVASGQGAGQGREEEAAGRAGGAE